MIKSLKSAVIFCTIFIVSNVWAVNFPEIPSPFRYINDYTNTLSTAEINTLETKLIDYSQQTSSQIAVVLVPTVDEYEIAEYTFELADKWGIGRKKLDNGVLMLIAINDHKMFIATGRGLEGALPDAFLSQVIRNVITPEFKHNNYALGINNGLDLIISASKGEYDAYQDIAQEDWRDYLPLLIFILFIIFIVFGELRGGRTPYISQTRRSSYNHYPHHSDDDHFSGGSGFGGGSSGGFGGGSFGGGGAGGSW
ncbi:uncharacterized protein EV697_10274 [Bisgaardia hudsonensis]|uniref:TPM domain-containing protein n=1 Tax=Bisgaardia hudsonensis TaxID=109472 RepID=A0A4R2N118_9PAST|nr:TPM domain-containing protein [Bisgaardia hudsonensis]QLB13218.1 methanol dehydrogenase [Bisgaardia hudsonensis]TCP13203.1 uncharacterized protein EV697_10274 [Bisgaardia hudsonensis]